MYDRDYVKKLEQEIESSGSNRFERLHLSSEKAEVLEAAPPEPGPNKKTAPRAAVARAR
jgi:hypothetical protein